MGVVVGVVVGGSSLFSGTDPAIDRLLSAGYAQAGYSPEAYILAQPLMLKA